ncbi:hypothetical protein RHMOL_Rhmol03G0076400 [Rhododendron molle]|uniref:Uncharacterized protein n=1 Tax=Rhododendron molle TaxID=49168 RepID=A0ACC0PE48_RHOML|nr:hypothetical protein RHMOL_Rhmol03G0076400 [Rhododendron molle]
MLIPSLLNATAFSVQCLQRSDGSNLPLNGYKIQDLDPEVHLNTIMYLISECNKLESLMRFLSSVFSAVRCRQKLEADILAFASCFCSRLVHSDVSTFCAFLTT